MKLHLSKNLLLRTPQFATRSRLQENWEALKLSIKDSSKEFFDQIENIRIENLDGLPVHFKNTIWKYFNRASYRATPYGSFASVSMMDLNENNSRAVISSIQQVHDYPDWTSKDQFNFSFEELIKNDAKLFTNSSFYKIGDQYRFIAYYDGQYELVDTRLTIQQYCILVDCLQPKSISKLLATETNASRHTQLCEDIAFLLSSQLLFSELHPNIIGEDYFARIGYDFSGNKKYQIAARTVVDGGLNKDLFQHVPALVEKIHQIVPPYQSPHLKNFITAFRAKYEYREIPLMEALDPELGIGYGAMTQEVFNDELIEQLQPLVKDKSDKPYVERIMGILSEYLLSEIREIDLEQIIFTELENPGKIPNTLSLLCTTDGKQIQVETLGGCTGTSLCGRFSHVNEAIHAHCMGLAKIEQQANPEVIFFDIGYSVGNVVDNINRRKQIYDYQLSLLNYDCSESPLTIDDLAVSVAGNQLILLSRCLGKRLIPRLASAYNYTKSDLPLFRILCDIQQQSLSSNLGLVLKKIIPGLKSYPRVFFKNIIVSPAAWKLMLSDLKNDHPEALKSWCALHHLPDHVRTGFADQTLCFDLRQSDHLEQLIALLRKHKTLELEEYLPAGENVVIDEVERSYAAQFSLAIFHNEEIYKGYQSNNFKIGEDARHRKKHPGSDWLYFELFCNPYRTDEILSTRIANFLEQNESYIEKWFFVRYKEDRDHLRLRIHVADPLFTGVIIENLYLQLERQITNGTISDITIRTYERELERYGEEQMDLVESHFYRDSCFALSVLKAELPYGQLYQLCMDSALLIGESEVFTPAEFTAIIQRNQKGFALEHDFKPSSFKLLNAAFQKHIRSEITIPVAIEEKQKHFVQSFANLLNAYEPKDRGKIFSSLFHMHINRLFASQQRTYEALIYYFIEKTLLRAQKMNASKQVN